MTNYETYYKSNEISPGIFHIYEPGNVCTTLITGSTKSLLIDTGYGMGNLKEYINTLTDNPIILANTHCHADHAGGNYLFEYALAHPFEKEVYDIYQVDKIDIFKFQKKNYETGKVPKAWPDNFDEELYFQYKNCTFISLNNHKIFDLGNRKVEAIYTPGHTRGCVSFFDYQSGLLMSGDNISSSIWIMFKQSAPIQDYRDSLEYIQKNYDISGILSSHATCIYPVKIIDYIKEAIDDFSEETSTLFIHPRHGYRARRYKKNVTDIANLKNIYIVYPESYSSH